MTIADAKMTTQTPPRGPETPQRWTRARVIELAGSQSGPGGPPVRVDPTMVDASTAARMRPSADARHI